MMVPEIVTVKEGLLRGTVENDAFGGKYLSFKGIRYAKPPLGDLRFKAPQPPERWDGVRDAKEHGNVCPHMDFMTSGYVDGSEDCLFLNVYVPIRNDEPSQKKPVLVFIHGGGFYSGSGNSDLYGPQLLVTQNIIVVTINYRLEVLGFLSLDNEDIPGNAGLKDQVAAMKWIKNNIYSFGGDPNNITIYGESAGGASVTFHMFSPLTTGLFNKVIAHSGTCINDWAYDINGRSKAFRLGRFLGNNTNNLSELALFFRNMPVRKLTQLTYKIMSQEEKRRSISTFFRPVVERVYNNQESYLTQSIFTLIKQGNFNKVPIIIGYNSKEGTNHIKAVMKMGQINEDFQRFVPEKLVELITPEKTILIGDRLKDLYFDDGKFSPETIDNMIYLITDKIIAYNVYRFAKQLVSKSTEPVYFFRFSCDSERNIIKKAMGFGSITGAAHADDLFYFFNSILLHEDLDVNTKSGKMVLQCLRLWSNFVKNGNPTPFNDDVIKCTWLPITNENEINYLEIGTELENCCNPDKKRMKFWDNVYHDVVSTFQNSRL